jgi:hypothetical protein
VLMRESQLHGAVCPTLTFLLLVCMAPAQERKLNSDEQSAVEGAVADTHHWTEVYPCPELNWDTVAVNVWPESLRMDPGLNGTDGSGLRTSADEVKPDGTQSFTEESGNTIRLGTEMIEGGEFAFGCSSEVNSMMGGGMLYSESAHQDLECDLGKDGIGKTNADHKKFLESEVEALDRWDRYLGWLLGTGLVPEVDQPKVNEIRKGVKETKKKTEEILKMF